MKSSKRIEWADFDLFCIVRYIARRFWMVIISALISVMAMYLAFSIMVTPTYTSSVTFSISSRSAISASAGNVAVTNSVCEQFGEVLSSDMVRSVAAKRMGLDSFPAEISIYTKENTNILILNLTATSPEMAYKSALAIMESHSEYSDKVFSSTYADNINGPTVPDTPNNASLRSSLLKYSAPMGALLVIALLAMMSIQADTVQTPEGAKHQVDGKLLATLYHERKYHNLKTFLHRKKKSLLITAPTCSFYYTETIHQLRVRLEHAHQKKGYQVFTVTSYSENEGKSTLAANLALSLAQKHRRVLLVDADLRKPSQNLIFEAPIDCRINFGQLITQGFSTEFLTRGIPRRKDSGLFVLFTRTVRRRDAEAFSAATFRPLISALKEHFDYIIIDTPPMGLFSDASVLADASDASLLVVRQDLVPAVSINDSIDSLSESSSEFLGFVLNNVRSFRAAALSSDKSGYGYGYGYGYSYGYGYGYGYGNKKKMKRNEKQATFRKADKKEDENNG